MDWSSQSIAGKIIYVGEESWFGGTVRSKNDHWTSAVNIRCIADASRNRVAVKW